MLSWVLLLLLLVWVEQATAWWRDSLHAQGFAPNSHDWHRLPDFVRFHLKLGLLPATRVGCVCMRPQAVLSSRNPLFPFPFKGFLPPFPLFFSPRALLRGPPLIYVRTIPRCTVVSAARVVLYLSSAFAPQSIPSFVFLYFVYSAFPFRSPRLTSASFGQTARMYRSIRDSSCKQGHGEQQGEEAGSVDRWNVLISSKQIKSSETRPPRRKGNQRA